MFHLKSCMWYCPPPKTMEMTKEEAWNQGFRSCWKCHPEDRPQEKPQEAVGSNMQGRGGICGQRCTWCDEGTCSRQKEVHVHCACTEGIRDHAVIVKKHDMRIMKSKKKTNKRRMKRHGSKLRMKKGSAEGSDLWIQVRLILLKQGRKVPWASDFKAKAQPRKYCINPAV